MFNIWISHGIFYGFSDESIVHFMRRKWDKTYHAPQAPVNGKLVGTGLVLSPIEAELSEEVIIAGIKSRRIVPDEFPNGKCTKYTLDQKLEFMNHPLFLVRYKKIIEILKTQYGLPEGIAK